MKLSIVTPVVSLHPGAHGHWEVDATIEDVALVAETADRLGYHHLTCSDPHDHRLLVSHPIRRRGDELLETLRRAASAVITDAPGVVVAVGTQDAFGLQVDLFLQVLCAGFLGGFLEFGGRAVGAVACGCGQVRVGHDPHDSAGALAGVAV
jgi:hypothetical protein